MDQNSDSLKGNKTISLGNNNMNFQCDQVMLLETTGDFWAAWRKANDVFTVFSSFELGGVTKLLMTGPTGNSEFCFLSTSKIEGLWETKLTVSLDASHEVLSK